MKPAARDRTFLALSETAGARIEIAMRPISGGVRLTAPNARWKSRELSPAATNTGLVCDERPLLCVELRTKPRVGLWESARMTARFGDQKRPINELVFSNYGFRLNLSF